VYNDDYKESEDALDEGFDTIKGRAQGGRSEELTGHENIFLNVLGLNSLEDLPRLREINEILKNEKT